MVIHGLHVNVVLLLRQLTSAAGAAAVRAAESTRTELASVRVLSLVTTRRRCWLVAAARAATRADDVKVVVRLVPGCRGNRADT